ncbi:hypothetical protein MJO55_08685 [Mycolicibacterium rufum]|uniref:Uncharacterized protein n=1 Tax=Mycolicibacterium rufum TaxID=318424 RepID=A0A9X3BPE5_9MYCO|nr:hypothetical protein [Mycolicibacterium rufum]MCV7069161.1 hypothetical protein [Mycolicibacterium rufum]ULP38480.1 hypothetical protein MJO55_08685 [Mycolicibacterium rufum]
MVEFDWRERPQASPWGGFFIQSRAGRHRNNFEVVIPWPDGGIAHFYRDNDDAAALQWYGPTLFAQESHYQGVSVTESDFMSYQGTPTKNLEVVAVRQDGALEHWWRENGGALTWHLGSQIAQGCTGVPAITYSGAMFKDIPLVPGAHRDAHEAGLFHLVVANELGGWTYYIKSTDEGSAWTRVPGFPGKLKPEEYIGRQIAGGKLVGMGIILSTAFATSTQTTYKDIWEDRSCTRRGNTYIIAGSEQNALQIWCCSSAYLDQLAPGGVNCEWISADTVTKPAPETQSEELRAYFGRPSIIQGDYNQDDSGLFDDGHYGNFELVSPLKSGGLLHRARNVGIPHNPVGGLTEGWGPGTRFGGDALYDEVSLIQSNYGGEHGNLELVARNRCQFGFEFFWRVGDVWNGPIYVGREGGAVRLGTNAQALKVLSGTLTPEDTLKALSSVNILTSVEPVSDMVAWLGDRDTPYPALADALLRLTVTRRLAAPVFIDVIRGFYEGDLGQPSPRDIAEVHDDHLRIAVLKASNENNGTEIATFEDLLVGSS